MQNRTIQNLINKLDRQIKRENRVTILSGLLLTLVGILIPFTVLSILEYTFYFNSDLRTILFFLLSVIVIITFVVFLVHPFFRFRLQLREDKYLSSAEKVGNHFPQVGDKLLNALQLGFSNEGNNLYSNSLIDAAIEKIETSTSAYRFEESVSEDRVRKPLKYFILTFLFYVLCFVLLTGFSSASYRLLNFTEDFLPPAKFYFEVQPGDGKITKGENFDIEVRVVGEKKHKIELNQGHQETEFYETKEIAADSNGVFRYSFVNPLRDFIYFLSADGIRSKKYSVQVINLPIVKNLTVRIIPPAYSKLPVQFNEDNGDISTLFGSMVELNLTASKNLTAGKIFFADSSELNLSVNKSKANIRFMPKKDITYQILIFDEDGNENLNPVQYSIKLITDNYPTITLLKPRATINLSDNQRVSTLTKIKDDYGFSSLTLNYRLSYSRYEKPREEYEKIVLSIPNPLEAEVGYMWNLSSLNLVTDDVVSYYFEVFDNDNISGPKSAKTEIMTARIPSLDEILAEGDKTYDNAIKDMQQTLKETEQLKKDIEELDRDLKSAREKVTWEEQKKAEEILKKQQEIMKRVENIQDQMNDLQNKLSENNLLSQETMQKFMELQELFNQLSSEEMKAAMQKFNEALKNISKQMMQDALKNFQFNEEMFRASIERTLELLKRVQIEQKMDEISKRLDELINKQDDLSQKLQNTNPNDKNALQNLSEQQKKLAEEIDKLEKELEDLEKKMSEFPKEMPEKDLKNMMQEFSEDNPSQCSNQASKEMMEGELSKAGKNQQNVKNSLSKMKKGMSQLKEKMMQNQMMMALNQMKKLINELLELSKKQEALKNKTQSLDPNSQQLNKSAQEQSELREDLSKVIDQMIELSNKTFAVTPEMGKAVGKANSEMAQSLNNFQSQNKFGATQNQTNAMGALNEAASLIQDMMQNMMQGGQGGGMMSFMQRLQQMSQQQMNLNNLTQMLGQGKLSMEQLSQLQRLASEQEMIRKSLEELNREIKESGQGSKMLGDLDDAVKKMEEVIREMRQNNVNDDVVQKQEKILTRLLDAQRSLNERDYEKRRESKPGEELTKRPPAEIDLSTQEGKDRLRQDLLRALEEGYAKDYEILIRKYFEALQKQLR
ncbi:MAG: hypothetical protein KJ666_15220 [Bacteroidetes bacterium]|nr:hypothetical protein [Bacteroidota bacterium]